MTYAGFESVMIVLSMLLLLDVVPVPVVAGKVQERGVNKNPKFIGVSTTITYGRLPLHHRTNTHNHVGSHREIPTQTQRA